MYEAGFNDEATAAAAQDSNLLSQAVVPAAADIISLLQQIDLSRVPYTVDPVCGSYQLQHLLQQHDQPHRLQLSRAPAAAYVMAV